VSCGAGNAACVELERNVQPRLRQLEAEVAALRRQLANLEHWAQSQQKGAVTQ